MTIEELIIKFSYFAIFFLITVNGITSFPSSQIIYVIAGYFAATGHLSLFWIIFIGALGHSTGNWILYEISRRKGLDYSIKFIKFFFQFTDPYKEIRKFQLAFNKRQVFFLFIGKLVNPIKIFIPIPAGIAKMNRLIFLPIVFITSAIWSSIFVFIGYYFGKSYENFGFVGVGILMVALLVMFYFYKIMNSKEILEQVEKEYGEKKNKK